MSTRAFHQAAATRCTHARRTPRCSRRPPSPCGSSSTMTGSRSLASPPSSSRLPRRAGAHDANSDLGTQQPAACVICGADMILADGEVAQRLDGDGNLDHDLDADHVALTPSDCYA